MVALEDDIESAAEAMEHSYLLKTCDSHEYAEEEEDRSHIDIAYEVDDAARHSLTRSVDLTIENLAERPQTAKNEKDADERWKICEIAEDRHKHETAHTNEEDCLALSR